MSTVPIHEHRALSIIRRLHQTRNPVPVPAHLSDQLYLPTCLQNPNHHRRALGLRILSHDLGSLYPRRRVLGSLHYGRQVLWIQRAAATRVYGLFCQPGRL